MFVYCVSGITRNVFISGCFFHSGFLSSCATLQHCPEFDHQVLHYNSLHPVVKSASKICAAVLKI